MSNDKKIIYFDNNGTTKICKPARDAMIKWLGCMSNPSGDSKISINARKMIADSKQYILKHSGAKNYRVIYTSGSSESNCLILISCSESYTRLKNQKPHIITSSIEHKSVIKCCERLMKCKYADVTFINPISDGRILPELVKKAIRPNTCLISIMCTNNELGTRNDIKSIGKIAHGAKIPFHTDAVQSYGKYKMNLDNCCIDAVSVSFHKLYGPMGIGMLIINNELIEGYQLDGQIAGTQHDGLRGGTENVPSIAGAIVALKDTFVDRDAKNKRLEQFRNIIINALTTEYPVIEYKDCFNTTTMLDWGVCILGAASPRDRVPNTLLVSFVSKANKFCNQKLKHKLHKHNIIVSIGSACNTDSPNASHVLNAIRAPPHIKKGVIRISLGDYNTLGEVKKLCTILIKCVNEVKRG